MSRYAMLVPLLKMVCPEEEQRWIASRSVADSRRTKTSFCHYCVIIVDNLLRFMDIIDQSARPEPSPKRIGFGVKERGAEYRAGEGRSV